MNIKIVSKSKVQLPEYTQKKSAYLDVRANISKEIVLKPFERALVNSGMYIELPEGYETQTTRNRICQMVIEKHKRIPRRQVNVPDDSSRRTGGFGHTRKK
jgi:dUTPase